MWPNGTAALLTRAHGEVQQFNDNIRGFYFRKTAANIQLFDSSQLFESINLFESKTGKLVMSVC